MTCHSLYTFFIYRITVQPHALLMILPTTEIENQWEISRVRAGGEAGT